MSIVIDDKEYYGIIYKIENMITHKIYIGQTTHPRGFNGRYDHKGVGIERVYKDLRSKMNRGAHGNVYLLRSIETCGFDAFVVDEVFDVALTFEELNYKESYYIAKYDSYKNGYNMTSGGDSISGYSRPTGKDCKNSKRVCQIDLYGKLIKIWDSATEACNELGVCPSTLSNVCRGKKSKNDKEIETAGGYVWVFEKDYDQHKDYSIKRPKLHTGHGAKTVLLLSDDGNIIKEYYSINDASADLGMAVESVRQTCLHKYKKPRFNLVYKNEYIEEQRLSVRELCEAS